MSQVLSLVSEREITRYGNGDHKILVIDTGSKENIIRSLLKRGSTVVRAFWDTSWEDYLPEVDGVFLTNGPGDPMDADRLISRVRNLFNHDFPIFGICFGHQILSLAAGAKTYKLKYGHRSVNQPVKDLLTGRCYITSQNHGYVVQTESLSRDWQPWFVNLNDGTNEGICHKTKPYSSVQFHPEASPGPNDTAFLFDRFIKTVAETKKNQTKNSTIHQLREREILV
jgi:carbamoyl-phosphate synthase small subunit